MLTIPAITCGYVQSLKLGGTAHAGTARQLLCVRFQYFCPRVIPATILLELQFLLTFHGLRYYACAVQLPIACCVSWSALPPTAIPIARKQWQRFQVRVADYVRGTSVRSKGRPWAGTHKVDYDAVAAAVLSCTSGMDTKTDALVLALHVADRKYRL